MMHVEHNNNDARDFHSIRIQDWLVARSVCQATTTRTKTRTTKQSDAGVLYCYRVVSAVVAIFQTDRLQAMVIMNLQVATRGV